MMTTAEWVASVLRRNGNVKDVQIDERGILHVIRNDGTSVLVGAVKSSPLIELEDVRGLFDEINNPQFVVSLPSESRWSGSSIELVQMKGAAFGRMGDLEKALRDPDVSQYDDNDYGFHERGLRQHSAVTAVRRLAEPLFEVSRTKGMRNLVIAVIDSYDVTAEDLRRFRSSIGRFDIATKLTSYGGITSAALETADAMGAEALKWKDVFRRLNKP